MPNWAGDYTVTAALTTNVEVGQGGLSGVLLGNESGLSIVVKFGGNYSRSLYPGTIDWFPIPTSQFSGTVQLASSAMLSNVNSWPSSFVRVDVYGSGEYPTGTYPAPLVRATNNGNVVNTNVTSTTAISNTGNPPLTNWLSVQPSDVAGTNPTWNADNSGNLAIYSDNAGVLTLLLQLIAGASPAVKIAAAGVLTSILGSLSVTGTSSLDNANLTTDGSGNVTKIGTINGGYFDNNSGGSKLRLGSTKANAGDIMDATSTDLYLKAVNGQMNFQSPSGTARWGRAQESVFSGSGSGSVATGVGGTPKAFAVDPYTTASGSQTIGLTLASTSQVTTGAGAAWSALAIR